MARADNKRMKWIGRWLGGALLLVVLAALGIVGYLRASLPQLDGEVKVAGLHGAVRATRDALGIPTIVGGDRLDVAYATGYLHAQDRFFQMDLMRRVAAGELAGLVGKAALDIDRDHRLHRFRARAQATLAMLPPDQRALIGRYVEGVNAGLQALHARPFEYALLRTQPEPWKPEDTLLSIWAMYFDLQGHQQPRKLARGWLAAHSSPDQLRFLLPASSIWDAPLDASAIDAAPAPIPSKAPDWFGLSGEMKRLADLGARSQVGSNDWGLAGSRSADGSAIVADDMHLGLRLPHIWYRAVLQFPDADGKPRRMVGVTLPGAPLVVVGSNGQVAWGFTNSYGDYLDLVELEHDPADPQRFKLAGGWEKAVAHQETLAVNHGAAETMTVLETSLGPVWQVDGKDYAVHWIAHQPGAVNFEFMHMEQAATLEQAQAVANRAGIPAQNMVAGDAAGHLGWTIAGPLPDRLAQPDAGYPYPVSRLTLGWTTLRAPNDYPRVNDPAGGQLWTANARQLAGSDYAKIGDGGDDLGARARQIRDDLTKLGKSDERGVYSITQDDRALYMSTWRDRALKALDPASLAGQPLRAQFRRLLEQSWDGHASVNSVGYRLARAYMHALYAELFGGADAILHSFDEEADVDIADGRWPTVVARLLDEHPAGWVPQGKADWHAVELAAIDHVVADLTQGGKSLDSATWGAYNTTRIAHPLARALPPLAPWLSAPAEPLPGDNNMPRVQGANFGASERLVVAPGHEERGILNMPGGQSGHPLSPYFLAGHAAWAKGEPTPLLPGAAVHTLAFTPQ